MSDDPEGEEPDGFIVIHYPVDGSEPYGIGPFPWVEELARALIERGNCACRKETLSVAFPAGVSMTVIGFDLDTVIAVAKEVYGNGDRLN